MKFLGLLLVAAVFVTGTFGFHSDRLVGKLVGDRFGGKIVGGKDVSITDYPWQISLRKKFSDYGHFKHNCGGSLITENIVLTAAHCVVNQNASRHIVVAGSSHRTGGDGVIARINKFIPHEKYDRLTVANDIALVHLQTPVFLNGHELKAVKLTTVDPRPNDIITVSGWGTLKSGGKAPEILQAVDVPVISNSLCSKMYAPTTEIIDSMFCAARAEGGVDSCQGDSGGPAFMGDVQYGVVSFGRGCAHPKYPGVYTSVASFRKWIDKNVKLIQS